MNALQCEKCGNALALADTQCGACGAVVPSAQRLAVLLPRAEALAEQERYAEAARSLDTILGLDLDVPEKKSLGRKKAAWLRKAAAAQPQLWDGVETALAEVLRLDDLDDLSHQVWIDLLVQRGLADKAKAWYQQRLELNPEDAMAKRQMAVLRLASDFKVQPQNFRSVLQDEVPQGRLIRIFQPGPFMVSSMALMGLSSLGILLYSLFHPTAAAGSVAPPPVDTDLASAVDASKMGLDSLGPMLMDPTLNAIQLVVALAYLYWAWKRRQRG